MIFSRWPVASHPRVVLRPIAPRDLLPWSQYLNDPLVYEHTSWNHPTPADLQSYRCNELERSPASLLRLAIARRDDDGLVGTVGFQSASPEHRMAELAYDLHPGSWGQGIATSVAGDLAACAHREAAVVRVQATVLVSTRRSRRVLQRLGFVKQATLEGYRLVRGEPGNFILFSHLA